MFFSENIVEEILLCTNLQGRRVATKWNAVQKDELLTFIGVLLLAGAEKKLGCRRTTTVLRPQVKSHLQKASFGVNRFENIQRNLRLDDKRTRVERLKQDKLAAFSYIWGLFIKNCQDSIFSQCLYYNRRTTSAIQRALLSLSAIHAKQTCQVWHQNLLAVRFFFNLCL